MSKPTVAEVEAMYAKQDQAYLELGSRRVAELEAEVMEAVRGMVPGSPDHLAAFNGVLARWGEKERLAFARLEPKDRPPAWVIVQFAPED